MEIEIVVNDEQVRALVSRANVGIQRALIAGVEDAQGYVWRQVTTYPPKPADSKYIRTNVLRGSWAIEPPVNRGTEVRGRVVSSGDKMTSRRSGIPYNRYVQDRQYQAQVHQGRWATVQDIAERSVDQITAMFQARIDAALGGV
jgi:hypothetical protein